MSLWLIVLLALAGSYLVANLFMALLFIGIGGVVRDAVNASNEERKE